MKLTNRNLTRAYAFGTILLWASAFIFTKMALQYYTAMAVGVLRYFVAAIFFIVIAVHKRIGLPDLKDVPRFFLSGAIGFTIYMILFNQGCTTLTSATSSIIIATAPVITAILARVILHEKVKVIGWIAFAIEFVGILVLTLWEGILSINQGIFWITGAALCISGYNLLQRKYTKRYSALQTTAYSIFAGSILFVFYWPKALSQLMAAPLNQWLIIIYMGVFPSAIAYLFWSKGLSIAHKTSDVTNFMFLTPLIATLMGVLMIREIPTSGTFAGGGIIIIGLFLFQKSNRVH